MPSAFTLRVCTFWPFCLASTVAFSFKARRPFVDSCCPCPTLRRCRDTGAVSRGQNYKSRYRNLSTNAHNWLRITRIMKCLGLLGFPHFVAPFLSFLVQEMLAGRLCRLGGSLRGFFVETLLNDNDRIALLSFLAQFD